MENNLQISQITKYKKPIDIIKFCHQNNKWKSICQDNNSIIWHNLIYTHYNRFINNKIPNISLKDYYVLLYYSEILGVIQNTFIVNRAQKLLNILPKIYNGDHITIINACFNTAITSNKARIILYRSKSNDNYLSKIYGSGCLRYQYLNSRDDLYVNEEELENIPKVNTVHPIIGGYHA